MGKPRTMSMDMLKNQDKIIVVADDVPEKLFSVPLGERNKYPYRKKMVFWNISDVGEGNSIKKNEKIIKKIMKKVDELNKKLKK